MKFLEGIRFDVQHLPHRPGREAGAIRQHRHVDGQSQVETVFCIYYIIRLQLYIPTLCLYIRSSILTLQWIVRVRMPSVCRRFAVGMPLLVASWDTKKPLWSIFTARRLRAVSAVESLKAFAFRSRSFLSNIGGVNIAAVRLCGNGLLL